MLPIFSHPFHLESLRIKTSLFPETLQTEASQLDINFRETAPKAHVETILMSGMKQKEWATQKSLPVYPMTSLETLKLQTRKMRQIAIACLHSIQRCFEPDI